MKLRRRRHAAFCCLLHNQRRILERNEYVQQMTESKAIAFESFCNAQRNECMDTCNPFSISEEDRQHHASRAAHLLCFHLQKSTDVIITKAFFRNGDSQFHLNVSQSRNERRKRCLHRSLSTTSFTTRFPLQFVWPLTALLHDLVSFQPHSLN